MKKLILLFVMAVSMFSLNAQTVETSKLTDNVSVAIKGGVVTPLNHSDFFGDMRAIVGAEISKQITPITGIGLEGEWTINTSILPRNPYSANVFDHQSVGVFGTTNWMNLIGGYKGDRRVFEIETVLGAGWLHGYVNSANGQDYNSWYTKAGANFNFNLGKAKAWAISLKPAIVYDMENHRGCDGYSINRAYLEVNAGVTYHFKNKNGKHSFKLCDKVATQSELDALNAEINRLRNSAVQVDTVVVDKVVYQNSVINNDVLNSTVGFTINSAKVSDTQYATLSNVADYLNGNPNAKIDIVGFADRDTGTEQYNKVLSDKRANAVKDILVNKFGISSDRLNAYGVGDEEQPFGDNNWNRVVVFMAH